MKIVKIGTFSKEGWPTGWTFDMEGEGVAISDAGIACIAIDFVADTVKVGGIEIVEWSEERRRIMNGKTD